MSTAPKLILKWDDAAGYLRATATPEHLYHYTSAAGLEGIIKANALWATLIHHLNDSTEFTLALELMRSVAEKDKGLDEAFREFVCETIDAVSLINICVFSLSEESDLLSQWRGYCANGLGYSIGMNTSALKRAGGRWFLVKCEYNLKAQRTAVTRFIKDLAQQFKLTRNRANLREHCMSLMVPMAAAFKSPAFSEEREWRLVGGPFNHDEMEFRSVPAGIVPYTLFPLVHEWLGSITVGPARYEETAKRAVEALLRKEQRWPYVGVSKVPFRIL